MRALLFSGAVLLAGARLLPAAEPVFTHIHPAGAQVGTTVAVTLNGTFNPWPCQVHADTPGLTFTPQKEAGKFDLTVAPDAAPGPHLLRAFNAEGASAPVAVVITSEPQTLEAEPNDDFRSAQALESGVAVINGRLDKSDDVDSFQLSLTKGQTLVCRVEANVLAAGFDAMLRITNSGGATLAFNHDGPSSMDPLLMFTAPADGKYIVQTMGHKYPAGSDILFAGGADCVYRLHLSTGPVVRNTWPLAVPRGQAGAVTVEGWNLPGNQAQFDIASLPACVFPILRSDIAEVVETAEPMTLTIPAAVSGRLSAHREEDRYPFPAVKGEVLEISVSGPDQGSEIDAWIKVFDAQGKELAVNDDAGGSTDPRLLWTAPEDGPYTVAVGDLTQRFGENWFYRLSLTRPVPAVTATTALNAATPPVAVHAVKIEAGKTAEVKITATYTNGFATPLKVIARGLPAGVTAAEVAVPEKGGEVTLTLTADPAAAPASQPFQLVLQETAGAVEYPVAYQLASVSEINGVPQGYRRLLIDNTPNLWLTVSPAAAAPAAPAAQ